MPLENRAPLGEGEDGLQHVAPKDSKIAGAGGEGQVGEPADHLIEHALAEGEQAALPPPLLVGHHLVILRVLLQKGEHLGNVVRPLLEVRVDQGDIGSGTVVESGVDGRLLAKVSGKAHHPHPIRRLVIELLQLL